MRIRSSVGRWRVSGFSGRPENSLIMRPSAPVTSCGASAIILWTLPPVVVVLPRNCVTASPKLSRFRNLGRSGSFSLALPIRLPVCLSPSWTTPAPMSSTTFADLAILGAIMPLVRKAGTSILASVRNGSKGLRLNWSQSVNWALRPPFNAFHAATSVSVSS